jgi:hypothetical protein
MTVPKMRAMRMARREHGKLVRMTLISFRILLMLRGLLVVGVERATDCFDGADAGMLLAVLLTRCGRATAIAGRF